MKPLLLSLSFAFPLLFFSVGFSATNLADQWENTKECIVVYVKTEAKYPNLTIACDGERVSTSTVKTEDQLADPAQYKAELTEMFMKLVNSTKQKNCTTYENETTWWIYCGSNKP